MVLDHCRRPIRITMKSIIFFRRTRCWCWRFWSEVVFGGILKGFGWNFMTVPAKRDCDNVNQLYLCWCSKHWCYKKINYYFCLWHLIFTWGVMIFMTPFILSHRASKRGLSFLFLFFHTDFLGSIYSAPLDQVSWLQVCSLELWNPKQAAKDNGPPAVHHNDYGLILSFFNQYILIRFYKWYVDAIMSNSCKDWARTVVYSLFWSETPSDE
jgi:hypothetical protein